MGKANEEPSPSDEAARLPSHSPSSDPCKPNREISRRFQVGCFFLDANGRVLDADAGATALFGADRTTLVGMQFKQFLAAEDRRRFAQFRRKVLDRSGQQLTAVRLLAGNVSIPAVIEGCVADEAERPGCWRITLTPVNDLKTSADALRATDECCRVLLEGVDVGITLIDSAYNVISANRKQADIVGRPVRDFVGKKCYREFEGRQSKCPHCPGVKAMATGIPAEAEASGYRLDGSYFDIRLKASPIFDAHGQATCFVEVVEDLKHRKQAERELHESEKRYRQLFEVESDAILMVDRDTGRILDANTAALTLYGYRRQEFLGLQVTDISADPRKTAAWLASGRTDPHLRWHRKKNGQIFPVEAASSSFDCQGRRVHVATIRDITERKRVEDNLREREEVYSAIVNQAADSIVLIDAETLHFAEFNDTACDSLGYTREEFASLRLTDLQADLSPSDVVHRVQFLVKQDQGAFENRQYDKNGQIRSRLASNRAIRIRGRQYLAAIWVDITERKQAENKLRDREEIYSAIVNQAADSIVLIDTETLGFAEFNDTACRELGYSREEFARLRLTDIQVDCTPDDVTRRVRELLGAGGGSFETKHRCKDGLIRDHLVSNRPVKIRGRDFLAGIWMDVTERKRVEEELALASQRLSALLTLSRMPHRPLDEIVATVVEESIRLTRSQIGYLAMLSRDEEVLTMHYWSQSAHAACTMEHKNVVFPLQETGLWGEAVRQRRPIITNDYAAPNPYKHGTPPGHVPIIRHMNMPVFDGERIVAVAGVGNKAIDYDQRDLHQLELLLDGWWQIVVRKQAQEELRKSNAELKSANKRLAELNRLAESATRAKSEFLANMSHEIRTPMTAILGFSDLLACSDLHRPEQRQFVEGIQSNGRALLNLIGDILDLSKIEAEKLTLNKQVCALRELVEEVVSAVRIQAEEKELGLVVTYEEPLPTTVETDPLRLRQILLNLLGNAVKFTSHGVIGLTIRCIRDTSGRSTMRFAVSDTGIGIAADRMADLFQPFTQIDGSASRRYGGTGLGLAISQRLAEALGGDIEVVSELGKGSTFTLTVDQGACDGPLKAQPPMALAEEHGKQSLADLPTSLRGRVLLAEDDPSIQSILRLLLEKAGLEVFIAETGRVACDLAERSKAEGKPCDLIFMDMQMPQMDGYEATKWLRQQGWQGPIVALTAHAMAGDREKCLAAGCDDYVAKPLIVAGLRDVLLRHLR